LSGNRVGYCGAQQDAIDKKPKPPPLTQRWKKHLDVNQLNELAAGRFLALF
jgi:hypothetical protein